MRGGLNARLLLQLCTALPPVAEPCLYQAMAAVFACVLALLCRHWLLTP